MHEGRGLIFEAAVMAIAVAVLVFVSFQRNGVWAGTFTIWQDTIFKSPGKARPHNSLGAAYAASGDYAGAAAEFRRAAMLPSGLHDIHLYNLALALELAKRPEEAADAFRRLLRLDPSHVDARYRLGRIYAERGLAAMAEAELRAAAEAAPRRDDVRNALGNVYLMGKRYGEAAEEYKTALDINPANVEAMYNLAAAFDSLGMGEDAARYYRMFIGVAAEEHADAAAAARTRLDELGAAR